MILMQVTINRLQQQSCLTLLTAMQRETDGNGITLQWQQCLTTALTAHIGGDFSQHHSVEAVLQQPFLEEKIPGSALLQKYNGN